MARTSSTEATFRISRLRGNTPGLADQTRSAHELSASRFSVCKRTGQTETILNHPWVLAPSNRSVRCSPRARPESMDRAVLKEILGTHRHEPSSKNWPVAAIAASACPQFNIRRSSGSFSSASLRVYVLDLFASRNRSLKCFMLLNSFVSSWNAFLSDSVDAARETNLRLCCARSLKLFIQSSVIGNPRWTALIRALRHSLITDICSMPALRKSFVNPGAA